MFGKIKDRLKNVFQNSEEIIEENPDEVIEEPIEEVREEPKEEKPKKEVKKKSNSKKKEKKKEEVQEELPIEEEVVEEKDEGEEEPKEEKKGFFSKMFHKKEEKDEEELEKVQDDMLEDVSSEEKEAVKENKYLPEETIKENKKSLEKQIDKEDELEKETLNKKNDSEDEGFFSKAVGVLKKKKITQEDYDKIWVELEIFLLEINIAYEIVEKINEKLQSALIENSFDRFNLSKKIRKVLEEEVEEVLVNREADLIEEISKIKYQINEPVKILILGVNGTGKTTSIAKVVNLFQKHNLSVVVAAADTFRAAATEQLEEHSKKLKFKLIVHRGGSDPAAVAYDAIEHAKAKKLDIVLIDTAGRMPNNSNLMNELIKIKKVSNADLSLFIGDSVSGNDLIDQIELFDKGVEINGAILTKVDTDEKPGSIVTTAYSIDKPIYYLGIGQEYDDLIKFDAKEIAKKLFEIEDDD